MSCLLSNGPNRKKWQKLKRKINRLEESFVVYRGRDVDAEAIAYQSGDITINERLCFPGEERLHRAPDGTYYLYREDESNQEHVHKLSLKAAILWSVTRANITGNGLRGDVNRFLRSLSPRVPDQMSHNAADTITINLSPAARAMLVILMDHKHHASLERAVLSHVIGGLRSLFGQVLGDDRIPPLRRRSA